MQRAVTLYEFMPYGAPELIESRQRHLSQALVIASAAALVLYSLAGGLAALVVGRPAEPHALSLDIGSLVTPPPLVKVAPPALRVPPAAVTRAAPRAALPVPVPDAIAPINDPPAVAHPDVIGAASTRLVAGTEVATAGPPADMLPAFGTYQYVEQLPSPLKVVKPDYPELPKQAGVQGLVRVDVLVGKDGRVLEARLDEKVQVPMLNDAALAAARQWVFSPGLANGRPVACWTAIPFRFRLH